MTSDFTGIPATCASPGTSATQSDTEPDCERPQVSRDEAVATAYALGMQAGRNLASLENGVAVIDRLSDQELWDLGTVLQEISRGRAERREQQARDARPRFKVFPGGAA